MYPSLGQGLLVSDDRSLICHRSGIIKEISLPAENGKKGQLGLL